MKRSTFGFVSVVVPTLLVIACGNGFVSRTGQSRPRAALTVPSLGTARSFSVLAGQTVTNTGPSTLNADLGVSPGTALTGFPPGLLLPPGTTHAADSAAAQGQADLGNAYDVLKGYPCTSDLTGTNLGEKTLTPGVYCFTSEALLTGTLVLDAKFEADAVFVFQIVSKLTTGTGASVRLINGANPCNVFWVVGSSATIGVGTSFTGNILALTSIALQSGASLSGRALARNGEVTLDDNQINSGVCEASAGGGGELTCCSGAVACNNSCVKLATDANHCGACGKSCTANEVCSAGVCNACPASRTQCTDQCADLTSDPFNCGACGKVCATSQSCTAGACGPCEGTVCSNSCVEVNTDRLNCGACGHACAADQCCNAGSCSKTEASGALCKPL